MGPAAQAVIDIDVAGEDAKSELSKLVAAIQEFTSQSKDSLNKVQPEDAFDSDDVEEELGKMREAVSSFANGAKAALATVGAAFAIDKVRDTFVDMLDVFNGADKVARQLNTTLKTTGNTTGFTVDQLSAMRNEIQDTSTASADTMAEVQNIFARTKVMGGDVFVDAQQTALDFAAAMGTDVKSAAEELSEAMMDPANELEKFRRFGITFTDTEKAMLTQMQTTGKGMEAQRYVLSRLNGVVGGQSKAAFESLGGQQEALGNKLDAMKASVGGMLSEALLPLYPVVSGILDVFNAWMPVIQEVANAVVSGATAMLDWIPTIETTKESIAGWAALVQTVFERWDDYIAVALLRAGANVVAFATDVQHYFTDTIPTYAKALFSVMKDVFFQLGDIIKTVVTNIGKNIENFWEALKAVMRGEMPEFTPTNLLEGFELKLNELPEHTAKKMSETESVMRQAANELAADLGKEVKLKTELKVKEAEVAENKANAIKPPTPPKDLNLGTNTESATGGTEGLTAMADRISAASAKEPVVGAVDAVAEAQTTTNELLANNPLKSDIFEIGAKIAEASNTVKLEQAMVGLTSQQDKMISEIAKGNTKKETVKVDVKITNKDVVDAIERSTTAIVKAAYKAGSFA